MELGAPAGGASTFGLENGAFRFDTQAADLYVDSNNASVLTEPAPNGNYAVETRVKLNVPAEGCCYNYVQAGLVIYGDDDNFIKLAHVSIWETRQTEFAKELSPCRTATRATATPWSARPRSGHTCGSSSARTPARSSTPPTPAGMARAGCVAACGRISLATSARIGLVSMGGSDFTANFDYVRVYTD